MNIPGRLAMFGIAIIAAIALAATFLYEHNSAAGSVSQQALPAAGQKFQPSVPGSQAVPTSQQPLQESRTPRTSEAQTQTQQKTWHTVFTYNATDTSISYLGDYNNSNGYFQLSGSEARIRYYCKSLDAQHSSDATLTGDIIPAEMNSTFVAAFATDARCGPSHTISYKNVPPATYFLTIIIPTLEDYSISVDDYY